MTTVQTTTSLADPAAGSGLYVYGVVAGDSACRLGRIGLDQQDVYVLAQDGLGAVVHDCPAKAYQSTDRPTLEAWIIAHQRVVAEAARQFGTVLPMTFNMIVHGQGNAADSLATWLKGRQAEFTGLLARLAGKGEYGVQILWDRLAVGTAIARADAGLIAIRDEMAGKPKGLAYMLEQKLAKATRAAVEAWAARTAGMFYQQIAACVDDVRVGKVGKGRQEPQMLLNLSCLVRDGETALGETLDRIALTPGITVRFTGPWPPYSFVGHS